VIHQPPSTARSDYFPYIIGNVAHLLAYPYGDVLSGPGSADDGPGAGHRSSRRPGDLRRLLHGAQGAQRAQPVERAEQPGITWGRVGPARLSGQPKRSTNALILIGRYGVPGGTIAAEVRRAAEPYASGQPVHVIIEDLA
jgi:hypothetical protein